jgi:hypothetical protein
MIGQKEAMDNCCPNAIWNHLSAYEIWTLVGALVYLLGAFALMLFACWWADRKRGISQRDE